MIYIIRKKINIIISFLLFLLLSSCTTNTTKVSETNKIIVQEKTLDNVDSQKNMTAEVIDNQHANTPKHTEYKINLNINPETNEVIGIQNILYTNTTLKPLDKLMLNIPLNAFSEDSSYKPYLKEFENKIFPKNIINYGYMNIENVTFSDKPLEFNINNTVLDIKLDKPLESSESIEISLKFKAYIPKINNRTGRDDTGMWFGNFLPTMAVFDYKWHTDKYYSVGDPFFTEISDYSVKITTPENYTVTATGEESYIKSDGTRITTVKANAVRDFAFAISDKYKVETMKTSSGIYLNIYYTSELGEVNEILEQASKGVTFFGQKLGAYPYSSIDIVEAGLFMNSGIAYPQIIFLDKRYNQSYNQLDTIIHEVGHQWFYNIVGSNQIDDPWLDEGIITLLQQELISPKDQLNTIMETKYNNLKVILNNQNIKSSRYGLSVYTDWNSYYETQYIRPSLMLYSLSNRMGQDKFNEFIKTYYNNYAFKIATKDDFIQTAELVYGYDLDYFFTQWLEDDALPILTEVYK